MGFGGFVAVTSRCGFWWFGFALGGFRGLDLWFWVGFDYMVTTVG